MGTTRTLDRCDGKKLGREPMEQGLLSRSGWAVVDDSPRHVLTPDGSVWKEWVEARPAGDRQDLYLFAYGHDYKQALADFQLVAGRAPLPPKYTFGYWWSRYWQYSDNEFVDLVQKLKSMDVPLDVLIIDMDWHETWGLRKKNPPRDEYGQRIGWTGYTWQKELFPSPANFLQWTENEQLKVALNLHPASGIQPCEDVYDAFTREYGWTEKGKSVPFRIDDRKWADAYFKTVLSPMERDGVDFWWLDWQQWTESKFTPGCRTPSGSTIPSSAMPSGRVPNCGPSSTTAGADSDRIAIRWHSRATPTPRGARWPTCRNSPPPPRT